MSRDFCKPPSLFKSTRICGMALDADPEAAVEEMSVEHLGHVESS